MSARTDRFAKFKLEHPHCCYCGGSVATQTKDHNPPRALFSSGAVPAGFRFPSCAKCNRGKKDAESHAAVISTAFNKLDPPDDGELKRSIERGTAFIERNEEFRSVITSHPTHIWDFARGNEPGAVFDPMSAVDIPHELPESFGAAMFELGRYFGQAMYYRAAGRPTRQEQSVGVSFFTNALPEDARLILSPVVSALQWETPRPASKARQPEFAVGIRYFSDGDRLFFAGERFGSFLWFGTVGEPMPELEAIKEFHWWRGNGTRITPG